MRANSPPYPSGTERLSRAKTCPFAIHRHNPAGSKLLRRAMKQATGKKRPTYAEAKRWYVALDYRTPQQINAARLLAKANL
jgi:hypothetical protein